MHSSSSFNQSFYTLIRTMWICGDARPVRPRRVVDKQTSGRGGRVACCKACRDARSVRPRKKNWREIYQSIGADARAVRPYMHSNGVEFAPIDYQRLETRVLILAILHGNLSHFAAQYNPYCTVKWVRLESHRADFETSHASCWFSTPILLRINHLHSMF